MEKKDPETMNFLERCDRCINWPCRSEECNNYEPKKVMFRCENCANSCTSLRSIDEIEPEDCIIDKRCSYWEKDICFKPGA